VHNQKISREMGQVKMNMARYSQRSLKTMQISWSNAREVASDRMRVVP